MRVGLITGTMNCGGVETFMLTLCEYLQKVGMDASIVTTVEPGEWFSKIEQRGLNGLHVNGFDPDHWFGAYYHVRRVGQMIVKENFDIVLLNHDKFAQAAIRYLPDEVKVIPILHNDARGIFKVGCSNSNLCNVLVAVSPNVNRGAINYGSQCPIILILNGVRIPDQDVLDQGRIEKTISEIVYVGRLEHRQKGIFHLPVIINEIVRRGIDFHLTIAGDGPDRDRLNSKFRKMGLTQRVTFKGSISNEDALKLLGESHLLLLPSHFEGLSIVLLEAQACGCVPIATRLEGTTDVAIEDGITGILVDKGSVNQFADAIVELALDRKKWANMSANGVTRIIQQFSWQKMCVDYVKLIEDSVQGMYPHRQSRRNMRSAGISPFSWKEQLPNNLRLRAKKIRDFGQFRGH